MTYKSRRAWRRWGKAVPKCWWHNGKIYEKALEHTKVTRRELLSALREAGCMDFDDVRAAMVETDESISVIPKAK